MKIPPTLALSIGLAIAALQAFRIGLSDYLFRQDTLESVHRAAEVWPNNADFYSRLADLDPVKAIPYLHHAVVLDPLVSKSWIALGLRVEQQGAVEEAERYYLEAARVDRQFLPAWTLANFYARRNDPARFWPSARNAAQMSYEDIRPLLRLAGVFTDSEEMILEQMIVPRPKVEREFLRFLVDENRDASAIAARILKKADREDVPFLMAWMNRLIETNRITEARELWNALSDKRLISYPHLARITNADFSHQPLVCGGFDWRITPTSGVDLERIGGGLRIQFSGNQPPAFEVVSQYLDVRPGSYMLSFEYRTVDISTATNLTWHMGAGVSEALPAAGKWTHVTTQFTAGSVNLLSLQELRAPGTIRPEGIVYFRNLTLTTHE